MRFITVFVLPAVLPVCLASLMARRQSFDVDPNSSPYCSWYQDIYEGDTCDNLLASWGLSIEDFMRWNPSITAGCGNFKADHSYCVEVSGEPISSSPTTKAHSSTVSSPPSTTGNGVATPVPVQAGMTKNCHRFYKVQKGDNCAAIITSAGIDATSFQAWNPALGADCSGLWADTYVCVGEKEGAPVTVNPTTTAATTTAPATVTTGTNSVATPLPTRDGMTTNCRRFYRVNAGDTCEEIITAAGIYGPNFYKWNSAIGEDCSGLWANVYVCIQNIVGSSITITHKPTTTAAPTAAGPSTGTNGVVTPKPIQTGMTTNCHRFYKVQKGDTCEEIISAAGIYGPNFYIWNPAVKQDCSGLWTDTYVCLQNKDGPSITITHKPTTTTKPAGVATPTPIQSGMVANCKTFYYVQQGDSCGSIAQSRGITVANFVKWNPAVGSNCAGMWANTWACVGL